MSDYVHLVKGQKYLLGSGSTWAGEIVEFIELVGHYASCVKDDGGEFFTQPEWLLVPPEEDTSEESENDEKADDLNDFAKGYNECLEDVLVVMRLDHDQLVRSAISGLRK